MTEAVDRGELEHVLAALSTLHEAVDALSNGRGATDPPTVLQCR